MRSPERGRAWAALALIVTGALFAALAAWALVARSTIPTVLDGTVTAVEVRHEKHPGVDDVWLVTIDRGAPRHVDREVAALLEVGDRVRKGEGDRTLLVNGEPHRLALSPDARAMLPLAPALAAAVAVLAVLSGRAGRPRRGPSG